MGSFSIWHWVVVLIIVLVLFGRGRVADIMGEFGKGITSFKKGVNEETARPADPVAPAARIEPPASAPATSAPAAPAPVAADPVPAAPVATEHTPAPDDRPGV